MAQIKWIKYNPFKKKVVKVVETEEQKKVREQEEKTLEEFKKQRAEFCTTTEKMVSLAEDLSVYTKGGRTIQQISKASGQSVSRIENIIGNLQRFALVISYRTEGSQTKYQIDLTPKGIGTRIAMEAREAETRNRILNIMMEELVTKPLKEVREEKQDDTMVDVRGKEVDVETK
jgi:hypothetical protein